MILVGIGPKYRLSREALACRFMRKTSPIAMTRQPCQTGKGRPRWARSSASPITVPSTVTVRPDRHTACPAKARMRFNSGTPFSVTTGSDKNLDGYNNDRPNLAPGVTKGQIQLGGHRSRFVEANSGWFNTTVNGAPAFVANGPGVAGGIGPGGADGNVPRDFLVGPGYRDIDMAVERDFVLPHGTGFEFRAEATNAFNMVSLNNPTGTLSSGSFSKISGAAPMRIFQFGGRFTF